jgi:FkbH-like protein
VWKEFDAIGLQRITQLINKTNQFNLTTRRYSEDEVRAVIHDPTAFGLQLRLLDRFGDNGIIAIVIARLRETLVEIDTWLMSCRVLGRQVEEATLRLVAERAAKLGATALIGEYIPTAKNGMVKELFARLGFQAHAEYPDGRMKWTLDIAKCAPAELCMKISEG